MIYRNRSLIDYTLLSIPLLLVIIFTVYPVAFVLLQGFLYDLTKSPLVILTSVLTYRALVFSFVETVLSVVVTVVLGLPGAFIFSKLNFRGRKTIQTLLIVPFILPPIVVVVGFLRVFGSFGWLDSFLMALSGSSTSVINLASGLTGIVLAHAFYNIPLVILMVSASLSQINSELEESAEILGANSIQKFRKIILPQILPSLLVASLLTALFCFVSFPIVLTLGGSRYKTLEILIYESFLSTDYGKTSTIALMQIILTIFITVFYFRASRKSVQNGISSPFSKKASFKELSIKFKSLLFFYGAIMIILVAGPILAIIQAAFYNPLANEYTLSGIITVFSSSESGGLGPLINSVLYATLATLLAIFLSIPLAYSSRISLKGIKQLNTILVLFPLGVSSITLAYGLMIAIAVPLNVVWPIIVIAQTIIALPFCVKSIESAIEKMDRNILDQADILGASRLQRLFYVELPLVSPGIVVGAVFAFAMAIGEMSATLFIAGPENYTLAVIIYTYLSARRFVDAGAAALILVVVCVLSFTLINRLSETSFGDVF